jgi:hypothetical protein
MNSPKENAMQQTSFDLAFDVVREFLSRGTHSEIALLEAMIRSEMARSEIIRLAQSAARHTEPSSVVVTNPVATWLFGYVDDVDPCQRD